VRACAYFTSVYTYAYIANSFLTQRSAEITRLFNLGRKFIRRYDRSWSNNK